jgi:hypothetical protein
LYEAEVSACHTTSSVFKLANCLIVVTAFAGPANMAITSSIKLANYAGATNMMCHTHDADIYTPLIAVFVH